MPETAATTERKTPSPRITGVAWGKIEVDGAGTFRDAKIFPGGARAWDWRETGTEHVPGIQPADVRELLDHGATTIVLSQGMQKCLEVPPETLEFLDRQGVRVHVLPTQEAVGLYNELRETEAGCRAVSHDLLVPLLLARDSEVKRSHDRLAPMTGTLWNSVGAASPGWCSRRRRPPRYKRPIKISSKRSSRGRP